MIPCFVFSFPFPLLPFFFHCQAPFVCKLCLVHSHSVTRFLFITKSCWLVLGITDIFFSFGAYSLLFRHLHAEVCGGLWQEGRVNDG